MERDEGVYMKPDRELIVVSVGDRYVGVHYTLSCRSWTFFMIKH